MNANHRLGRRLPVPVPSLASAAAGALLLVALLGGCYPGNDGYYLQSGATEDVAMFIKTVYVHPQPGTGPDLPTNQFDGRVFVFDPGAIFPDRIYMTDRTTWVIGGIFSTPLTNESDPTDTGSMSGQVLDEGADGTGDVVNAELALADGSRAVSLRRFDPAAWDTYKCLGGPGSCPLVLGQPECTFDALPGDRTFHIFASMPFKIGDGIASIADQQTAIAYDDGGCSGGFGIPGSGIGGCGTTITTTVSGDVEGTITFDVESMTFAPYHTWVGFGVVGKGGSPPCALPAA